VKVALVAAGAAAKECVTALRLSDRLGPVAASSYRVASRIANSLRAGTAVKDYSALAGCETVLVSVPDSVVSDTVAALRESGIDWGGMAALLYSARRDSRDLRGLRQRHASVGSLRLLEGVGRRFLVEGDAGAVRAARRLVQDADGKTLELDPGSAVAYLAAVSFSSSLFTPLIEAAAAALRYAGIPPAEASRVAPMLFDRALRAHKHGGKKSWSGPLAVGDEEGVLKEAGALTARDPALGRYYRDACVFALEWFGKHPELLRKVRGSSR
jgi:predicted short-subunit dehydrogenase-like oxidoreductase (DUF2520 family)